MNIFGFIKYGGWRRALSFERRFKLCQFNFTGMKCVVTGGAGIIGRKIDKV
jgi:hypothetical protein